jgi:hypothetical protein
MFVETDRLLLVGAGLQSQDRLFCSTTFVLDSAEQSLRDSTTARHWSGIRTLWLSLPQHIGEDHSQSADPTRGCSRS